MQAQKGELEQNIKVSVPKLTDEELLVKVPVNQKKKLSELKMADGVLKVSLDGINYLSITKLIEDAKQPENVTVDGNNVVNDKKINPKLFLGGKKSTKKRRRRKKRKAGKKTRTKN